MRFWSIGAAREESRKDKHRLSIIYGRRFLFISLSPVLTYPSPNELKVNLKTISARTQSPPMSGLLVYLLSKSAWDTTRILLRRIRMFLRS
jgi:hypothetical protein